LVFILTSSNSNNNHSLICVPNFFNWETMKENEVWSSADKFCACSSHILNTFWSSFFRIFCGIPVIFKMLSSKVLQTLLLLLSVKLLFTKNFDLSTDSQKNGKLFINLLIWLNETLLKHILFEFSSSNVMTTVFSYWKVS
jgi:hypothetical protein